MPREIKIKSIRDQLPLRYRYTPAVRAFMLVLSSLILIYSLFFLIRYVRAATPIFYKLLPLIIMFVALDSLFRQLTSLNSVSFFEDHLRFSYLAKRKVEIAYPNIISMELVKSITYYLKIVYKDQNGTEKTFRTPASFPKILEIILNIADLSPNIQLNEMLGKAVELLRSQKETTDEQ